MENKLRAWIRVTLAICSALLLVVLLVPIWRIDLEAPQYPEGLSLLISAKGLSGDVAIVNGLNHYIGMKELHSQDFIEFTLLPYLIILFAVLFALAAFVGRKKLLNIVFFLFVLFGVIAMIDFWRWEYQYGHDLNPDAAIVVPGMAYQPPLIGFKQLLNFGAFSIPDIGGWLFILVGALALLCIVVSRKSNKTSAPFFPVTVLIGLPVLLLSSCSYKPEPITIGKDNCDHCKMTVMDKKFGAELITNKGKVFKFDDIGCAFSYIKSSGIDLSKQKGLFFLVYDSTDILIDYKQAIVLKGEAVASPMSSNIVAFLNPDAAKFFALKNDLKAISVEELMK